MWKLILRHAWLNLWDKHMTTGRINQVSTTPPSWHTCTNCHNTMYGQCAALSWCVLHSHKQHVVLTSVAGSLHLLTYIVSASMLSSKRKPAHSKYTIHTRRLNCFSQCCNAQTMWNTTSSLPYHRKPKHQPVLIDKPYIQNCSNPPKGKVVT